DRAEGQQRWCGWQAARAILQGADQQWHGRSASAKAKSPFLQKARQLSAVAVEAGAVRTVENQGQDWGAWVWNRQRNRPDQPWGDDQPAPATTRERGGDDLGQGKGKGTAEE